MLISDLGFSLLALALFSAPGRLRLLRNWRAYSKSRGLGHERAERREREWYQIVPGAGRRDVR